MLRILFFIALVLALGFGFAWLADRPGDIVMSWQGQRIEMSLMVFVSLLVSLVVAIMLTWWIIRTVLTSPTTMRRFFRARKRDRGYQALSTGLIAAGSGDSAMARQMNKRARSLISADQEPLLHLLEAQAALIEGKHDDARLKFEAMAEDPETRELGLRGLYLEARRLGATEAAQQYAEKAASGAPHLPWAAQAALEYKTQEGNWDDALALLEKQRVAKAFDKAGSDRKKAVLLTARALEKLDADPKTASADALQAVSLAPDLVPAAVVAGRALFRAGNLRKGSRVLEKMWKLEPHPEIADAYVRARIGDSVQDRLKRAERLESLKANNVESLYAVAQAALHADDYELARSKAESAAKLDAREGIYMLLADIEEADTGDQARVRHWLAQAVRAPRDPAWTADNYVSERWVPVSPLTGRLDAFTWKTPLEQIGTRIELEEAQRAQTEEAIRSLPAVAVASVTEIEPDFDNQDIAPREQHVEESNGPEAPEGSDAIVDTVDVDSAQNPDATDVVSEPEVETSEDVSTEDLPAEESDQKPDLSEDSQSDAAAEIEQAKDVALSESELEKDEAFLTQRPDDPGVRDKTAEETEKQRFRLF